MPKKLTPLFPLFFLLFINGVLCQNNIGEIGSYWLYNYEYHSGNGFGKEMISVEKDTSINGELHQVLRRTYERTEFNPQSVTLQGSNIYGTMFVKNDSVFVNGELILDFTMEVGDTTEVFALDIAEKVFLVTDSIGFENINGIDHKKWFLQKLCPLDKKEVVTVIEGIGQIGEYLFWNSDGCHAIGGGTNKLSCYRNGSFTYPEVTDCEQLVLVSNQNPERNSIKIYPNPVKSMLQLSSDEMPIDEIKIYNYQGMIVYQEKFSKIKSKNLDLSFLTSGFYYIQLSNRKLNVVHKLFKD